MYLLAAWAVAVVLFSIWKWNGRHLAKALPATRLEEQTDGPVSIKPLDKFDWREHHPARHRPFKPVYHITMAIQNNPPEDLVIIDSNYLHRVTERRKVIKHNMPTVLGTVPEGVSAVNETWTYLISDYLPARYPTMFSLSDDGATFHNKVTKVSFPVAPPKDPNSALQALGETIEDDLFLLQETPEGHRAVAFICCHPAGFDPSDKLGKLIKDIHKPVPSYDKIGASMERFFSRLQVGKCVKRMNWSVSTDPQLFSPSGLHIYDGDEPQEEEVDISKARLRQELQTLSRLPRTGAVLFGIKTYLTPLEEIKKEGLGPQLADAIEGLKAGNAPGMWVYKGAVRWGKSVCEYLRS
ncbi:hypothetical protein Cob_v013051 [Colletotrichum orbiculare MAFF 240422]|uniref:HRQ family protein 2 n=1 Tax=Colletotrichum orbiculare (strain 104-T / ATCC 96160 / CBS 514.97 / LARS 414 / MAFF 240422) TaxID=1213857 RepID=A0A484F9G5_COLOR|nr:hypothetical protein Cob_v013051 [Colletotrichum orbiculare MAFF 240422]